MNDVPNKIGGTYKRVNLTNSDLSSSLSRTHSTSRQANNKTWNRMPNMTEINRGKDAQYFRETLKRSTSRKDASIERDLKTPSKYDSAIKGPQKRLNRATSELSMYVKRSYGPKNDLFESHQPKMGGNLSRQGSATRQNMFCQTISNPQKQRRHTVSI